MLSVNWLLQTGENLRVFLFVINCGHASAPLPDYIHHPYPTSSPIAENDKIWNISRCSRLQASYQSCSTVKISHYQSRPCHRTMGTESIWRIGKIKLKVASVQDPEDHKLILEINVYCMPLLSKCQCCLNTGEHSLSFCPLLADVQDHFVSL